MAQTYKVNWPLHGLKDKPLAEGATVSIDADEAKPLVDCGVLSPCKAESAAGDAGDNGGDSTDLSSMNKAQLVEYAQQKLNVTLDINKKRDELLAAIAEAAGK